MIFQNKKVLDYLLRHGRVYTCRLHKRGLNDVLPLVNLPCGRDWITNKRGGKKIADVLIVEIAQVNISELDPYWVKRSGFNSKEEWIEAIKSLNKGKDCDACYVYRVSLLQDTVIKIDPEMRWGGDVIGKENRR